MSPERVAELRRLCSSATPGPWEAMTFSTEMVNSYAPSSRGYIVIRDAEKNTQRSDSDAAFIAAARTALPEALDRIDYLDMLLDDTIGSIKRMESAIERVRTMQQYEWSYGSMEDVDVAADNTYVKWSDILAALEGKKP